MVSAQKRIGAEFVADGRRQSRLAFRSKETNLFGATLQIEIVRLDCQGKAAVGLGIFMAAVDPGLAREGCELPQRVPHHLGRSLDDAAATHGKERVTDEGD